MLERFFRLEAHGTTVRREVLGGVTTFATMAYNIGNGLTAGLVLYPLVKVAAGRAGEVKGGARALAAISAVYFAFGLPH